MGGGGGRGSLGGLYFMTEQVSSYLSKNKLYFESNFLFVCIMLCIIRYMKTL